MALNGDKYPRMEKELPEIKVDAATPVAPFVSNPQKYRKWLHTIEQIYNATWIELGVKVTPYVGGPTQNDIWCEGLYDGFLLVGGHPPTRVRSPFGQVILGLPGLHSGAIGHDFMARLRKNGIDWQLIRVDQFYCHTYALISLHGEKLPVVKQTCYKGKDAFGRMRVDQAVSNEMWQETKSVGDAMCQETNELGDVSLQVDEIAPPGRRRSDGIVAQKTANGASSAAGPAPSG